MDPRRRLPGNDLAVGQRGALIALKAFGRTQYAPDAPVVAADQIFDLASVTKVVGTTTAVAILYEENKLALDSPVLRFLHELSGTPEHDRITIRQLLTHGSGLPTRGPLYEKTANKAGILKQVYTEPLDSPPGAKFAYHD